MDCPCTSGRPFAECCQPILTGAQQPGSPEALMRARYTAYATGAHDFIRDSHVPSGRHEVNLNSVREWSEAAEWSGMDIVRVEGGGPADDEGLVEFRARYALNGEELEHHEIATFSREDGQWFFVDGQEPRKEPFRRTGRKVKPNEPCPCGSGSKYKKCCGKPGAAVRG